MKCNVCGRQIQNEEANFCEYCGSSFREQRLAPDNTGTVSPRFPMGNNSPKSLDQVSMNPMSMNPMLMNPTAMNPMSGNQINIPMSEEPERPTTFANWLGTYGILFIPIVGIVMLFIWAFGKDTPISKKNWARATLVWAAIIGVVLVILLILIIVSSPMYQDMYREMKLQMQNGTYDPNTFYNDMMNKYSPGLTK